MNRQTLYSYLKQAMEKQALAPIPEAAKVVAKAPIVERILGALRGSSVGRFGKGVGQGLASFGNETIDSGITKAVPNSLARARSASRIPGALRNPETLGYHVGENAPLIGATALTGTAIGTGIHDKLKEAAYKAGFERQLLKHAGWLDNIGETGEMIGSGLRHLGHRFTPTGLGEAAGRVPVSTTGGWRDPFRNIGRAFSEWGHEFGGEESAAPYRRNLQREIDTRRINAGNEDIFSNLALPKSVDPKTGLVPPAPWQRRGFGTFNQAGSGAVNTPFSAYNQAGLQGGLGAMGNNPYI